MDPDLGRYPVVWAAAGLPTAVFPVPPGTLRILANATVAPITEDAAREPSRPSRPTRRPERVTRRTAQRDDHLPGRPARPLALGGQRPGRRRSSPCPRSAAADRPRARASPRTRSRCVAPSCASRARGARGPRASPRRISDEPRAVHWDTDGLLVVAYGFHTFGLDAPTGEARWDHRSATPIVALLGSSAPGARHRPGGARDLRDRARRHRRLAGRALGRRRRRRSWSAAAWC